MNTKRTVAAALAVAILLGTSWSGRAVAFHANVDPALRSGDLALIEVNRGTAWSVSDELASAGATEITTLDGINVVTARVTDAAIAKIVADRAVRVATTDVAIRASAGPKDKDGKDLDEKGNGVKGDSAGAAAIDAPRAWSNGATGAGIVVALVDSGIANHPALEGKVLVRVNFVKDHEKSLDPAGHGTHLAGVIAGNGEDFHGVAPGAKLVSLRVLDKFGNGTIKDVLGAFDWLLKNRKAYNVRVANLSFGAPEKRSYHEDLLSAVAESAWFAGITIVAAAGNDGPGAGTLVTPGSDPFVITAGSFDDQGTGEGTDDQQSSFSSRGPSKDGFAKPDVLAPGRRVVSLRANGSQLETERPDRLVNQKDGDNKKDSDGQFIRMTGTSVSSAMVSGVAALVLSAHRDFTPTKVKGAIVGGGRAIKGTNTPAVDAFKALSAMTAVNVKLAPSKLLLKVLKDAGVKLSGITWEGVTWEGVTWEGVTWEAVTWEAVTWESVSWESVSWESVSWEVLKAK